MTKLVLLIILLCIIPTASAGLTDVDIFAVLPALMVDGFNMFLESLGDQLYNMCNVGNASASQNGITLYLGEPNNFISTKGIQDQKDFNAFWFLVGYVLYAGYGAAKLTYEKSKPLNGFGVQEGYTGTYISTLVAGIVFFLFYLYGIDWLCKLEWLLSTGFVINASSVMPNDVQHGLSYLLIAIGNIGVWAFMMLRDIVCYMVVMYLLWLIIMRKIPYVGFAASMILIYGVTLFFSRIMIAFVFFSGAGTFEALGIGGLVIPYLILMVVILALCVFLLMLPYLVIKGSIMFMGMRRGSGRASEGSGRASEGSGSSGNYYNEEILHE